MDTVYLAYCWGDDSPCVLGIGTDVDKARGIIKAVTKGRDYRLVELPDNKFKIPGRNDGESYHYWVEEVKTNKPI
jgi:hypothetical protein